MRLRAALLAVAVAGSAAAVVAIGTGSASADEMLTAGPTLPIAYASDVLVDPVRQHVLISDDQTGQLVITDYRGELIAVRGDLPGIEGLALSPDSKTVYAAVADAHAIVAFDAATVTEQTHYSVDVKMFPKTVATVGQQIWFGFDAEAEGDFIGNFGVLEPADRVLRVHDNKADRSVFHDSPTLLASPGRLIVADTSNDFVTSGQTFSYTIGADGLEHYQTSAKFSESFLRGVKLTADRTSLIGWGIGCAPWKASAATPYLRSPAYEGLCDPTDVGVHPDGRVAIGYNNFDSGTDVAIYPAGSEKAAETFTLPSTHVSQTPDVVDRLAWQPDGPRLFAISHNPANLFRLTVINGPDPVTPAPTSPKPVPTPPPARVTPTLTLSGNGSVNAYGSTVTVTAKLGAPGRTIEIWADPAGADLPSRLLRRMPSNSEGVLTASIKLTRNTVVSAKFLGDAQNTAKEVKVTMNTRIALSFVNSRHYKTVKSNGNTVSVYRKTVKPYFTFTATPYPSRKIRVYVSWFRAGQWRSLQQATLTVNAAGKAYLQYTGPRLTEDAYRVTVDYQPGDLAGVGGKNDVVNYTTHGSYKYFRFTN